MTLGNTLAISGILALLDLVVSYGSLSKKQKKSGENLHDTLHGNQRIPAHFHHVSEDIVHILPLSLPRCALLHKERRPRFSYFWKRRMLPYFHQTSGL